MIVLHVKTRDDRDGVGLVLNAGEMWRLAHGKVLRVTVPTDTFHTEDALIDLHFRPTTEGAEAELTQAGFWRRDDDPAATEEGDDGWLAKKDRTKNG